MAAAVETNDKGRPPCVELTAVAGFRPSGIVAWARQHPSPGARALSDGLACFHSVAEAGWAQEKATASRGRASVERPEFGWVNTILSSIENALRGICGVIRSKYARRHLSEFEHRFNRRFDLPNIILRLPYAVLRTPPMPQWLLKRNMAAR